MRCPRCGFGNSKSATECKECEYPLHAEPSHPRKQREDRPEWRPHDGPISTKEYAEQMLAEIRTRSGKS